MKVLFLLMILPLVSSDRIIKTNTGPIRGISVADKKVEAFLGIPFAEPPVGELRFARPIPKTPWDEVYDATEFPPACIQADFGEFHVKILNENTKISEDCLFLNLWVPEGGSDLKPILVFIHGGGFKVGTASLDLYDGTNLAERGDIIVASFNYRLGVLGFFYASADEAPGNMGMYDQVMAIQWLKDNAKYFGGDPDNIVLMGESAGAWSVSLHMVSPLSKNLFKRGILQSGSVYHPMYSDDNKLLSTISQSIASTLECASDDDSLMKNPKDVVECMKRLPAEKFSAKTGLLFPRVGDDFLPVNPIDLFHKGSFNKNEVLLGITRNEGSVFVLFNSNMFNTFGDIVDGRSFNETSVRELASIYNINSDNDVYKSYFGNVKETSYLDAASDFMGDFVISCSTVFQADYQSLKGTPVYFYVFDYRPDSSVLADWMGVAHFDEVQYVFGNPMYETFTKFEEEFSKDIMDRWISFTKTGNPSLPGEIKWPHYTYEDPKYYVISRRDGVSVRPDNHRCEALRDMFRSKIDV